MSLPKKWAVLAIFVIANFVYFLQFGSDFRFSFWWWFIFGLVCLAGVMLLKADRHDKKPFILICSIFSFFFLVGVLPAMYACASRGISQDFLACTIGVGGTLGLIPVTSYLMMTGLFVWLDKDPRIVCKHCRKSFGVWKSPPSGVKIICPHCGKSTNK